MNPEWDDDSDVFTEELVAPAQAPPNSNRITDLSLLDEVECGPVDPQLIYTEFLTGAAGTGKTFTIKQRIAENPRYAALAATTGIAAVNLGEGVTTIHSLLKYFNTESLQNNYVSGDLSRRFISLGKDGVKNVVIDEVSMLDATQLDLIYKAAQEAADRGYPVGLILTGDFCQLPPVPDKDKPGSGKFAFEAECWETAFSGEHMTKLEKVWRQADPLFLEALNAARRGDGVTCADSLVKLGVEFAAGPKDEFDGTTLYATNPEVSRYNQIALERVEGKAGALPSSRWGRTRGEWKEIPDQFTFKIGALVMILANEPGTFTYVNGDLGHITALQAEKCPETGKQSISFVVELKRNGREVVISKIIRKNDQKDVPREYEGMGADEIKRKKQITKEQARKDKVPYWDSENEKRKRWVVGEVEYYPLRLGYASTIHKSQGLSLDQVQVDTRAGFFASPAMAYVSLSRCRTPQGLRVIGDAESIARKCKVNPKVMRWL